MRRPLAPPPRRFGFTMVELLVVIVVLAILVGLLVPAVMRAVGTAKEGAVAAEINQMAQALADFKNRYGIYPPSRIVLSETGNYSSAGTGNISTWAALGPRSLSALRRLFPRMQLSSTGPVTTSTTVGSFYDFNGNQTNDGAYMISGFECLVFFLGGVPLSTASGWSVTGFSKNPTNPMVDAATVTNRTPPLFEFNNSRLDDVLPLAVGGTANLIPEYHDSLGGMMGTTEGLYAYFSAYEGTGYDPDDCNVFESDDTGTVTQIKGWFTSSNSPGNTSNIIASLAPNPYTADIPVSVTSSGAVDTTSNRPHPYVNPQTFQLISPGRDHLWGIGGQYAKNSIANKLPFLPATTSITGQSTLDTNIRSRERDNITNFSGGRLD